jgi:hypothetical protein
MLKVVCFKWKRNTEGFNLPHVCDYTFDHVLKLRNMVKRFLRIPHEFICITDDATGLEDIKTLPLWDKCKYLGGCFNRMYVFSEDMKDIIGDRFVIIDLDCVIVRDITPLFNTDVDFKMNSYQGQFNDEKDQYYNGAMVLMNAGARKEVWGTFDFETSPKEVFNNPTVIGTDQAWIRMVLGKNEQRWGPEDGVYEARNMGEKLPKNAKIVFFSGKRDPSTSRKQWVRVNYK